MRRFRRAAHRTAARARRLEDRLEWLTSLDSLRSLTEDEEELQTIIRALAHRNASEKCPLVKFALCTSISGRRVDVQYAVRALAGNGRIASASSPANQFVRAAVGAGDALIAALERPDVTPTHLRVRADDVT